MLTLCPGNVKRNVRSRDRRIDHGGADTGGRGHSRAGEAKSEAGSISGRAKRGDLGGLSVTTGTSPTSNLLERRSQEIKRRTRVMRLFPNEAACVRLISALAMKTDLGMDGERVPVDGRDSREQRGDRRGRLR